MNLEKQILINIRKIRESKSFSQESIAHELEMTQSAYAKLENLQNKISLAKLIYLSEIFETDLLHLISYHQNLPEEVTLKNVGQYISNLQTENRRLTNNCLDLKKKYIELLEKNDAGNQE